MRSNGRAKTRIPASLRTLPPLDVDARRLHVPRNELRVLAVLSEWPRRVRPSLRGIGEILGIGHTDVQQYLMRLRRRGMLAGGRAVCPTCGSRLTSHMITALGERVLEASGVTVFRPSTNAGEPVEPSSPEAPPEPK